MFDSELTVEALQTQTVERWVRVRMVYLAGNWYDVEEIRRILAALELTAPFGDHVLLDDLALQTWFLEREVLEPDARGSGYRGAGYMAFRTAFAQRLQEPDAVVVRVEP